jgi:hypothetical protein
MTKIKLIGAAAILSSVLVAPAMARHVVTHPVYQDESSYCASIEPGNPRSEQNDYQAWSAGRSAGWDSRGDDACARNPAFHGSF